MRIAEPLGPFSGDQGCLSDVDQTGQRAIGQCKIEDPARLMMIAGVQSAEHTDCGVETRHHVGNRHANL